LCYGIPLKIAPDPNLHETIKKGAPVELQRNEAAVDSELAWLPLIEMNVLLSGPLPNWTYGTTKEAALNPTNGILLVARLDGPTPEIARGLVDKALEAERDGLWGRAYFDLRLETSATPVTKLETTGFAARRKSAANWVLKRSLTKSRKRFPQVFR
jgi:uncharacterized protein (TIGR03790 family)